jgi:hypothetical protein
MDTKKKYCNYSFFLCRTKYFSHFKILWGKLQPPPPKRAKNKESQQIQNACDFNTHESDFYTQSKISADRVWFTHAECNFDTYEFDKDTLECDLYTKCVISTRRVISTRTSVIPTRTRLVSTRRVWFYMQRIIHRRVSLTRMRVNMTLTSVISTRSSLIPTRRV